MRRVPGKQSSSVRRAAFPQDAWGSAPSRQDAAWQAVPRIEPQAQDPWQADFVPASPDWFEPENPSPAFFNPQPACEPGAAESPEPDAAYPRETDNPPVPKAGLSRAGLAVSLVSAAVILLCLISVLQARANIKPFNEKLAAMQGQAFFRGITIDGLDVKGSTPQQLRQYWQQIQVDEGAKVDMQLLVDQTAFRLDSSHIPFSSNREAVMEEAWSIGRQTHLSAIGTRYTPFETRYAHTQHTLRNGAAFSTRVSYSVGLVDALAEGIARQVNREPINAIVSSFDFRTKEFQVTQDVPGRRIEAREIAQALKQALDRGDYRAVVRLNAVPLLPAISSVDLKNRFTMLASYNTKTSSDEDRNFNIALAAQAISNLTLMPGEVFSFNEATGQRTIQKGYRGAPAIQGGVLIDDVGGGVCQVSSTLFYSAAAAGMSIVERSPHAWPVSYMDKGLDATVNWPNLDFKFRNDQDTPVFIIASYEKRQLTVEFYGMLEAPGESIRLEAVVVSSQQPPREPLMQPNPSLPPFTQQELKQARTGYVVDTYRVYLRDGREFRREKLFTSNYKMVQQVIEYN